MINSTVRSTDHVASNDSPPSVVTDVISRQKSRFKPKRIELWTLGIGLVGVLIWAGFAPLDEGVPGQGMVTIDTKSKAVQHLSGGIVKDVLVREGQQVVQGQVLIRLDDGVAKSSFESARQRYLGNRAMQGRLLAEQGGLPNITWHQDLIELMSDPQIRQMTLTQKGLFDSRRTGLQADLRSLDANILGQQAMLQSDTEVLESRRSQLSLLSEELKGTSEMVAEGYVPRVRQMELQRNVDELKASISTLLGNITRAKRSIDDFRQRAIVRQQEYRKEVESQLAEVERDVQGDAEAFHAAKDNLDRIEIKSPAAGQVVGLGFQTVGGVIGPGQKIMDIVPSGQGLLLEAKVAPHLIDKVHADLPVDVRFSSFANSPQLVIEGKVLSVSADLITDAHSGVGYFLARVEVTPQGLKKLGKRQLQPGMPVDVIFITGERSMLTYLLHPLAKRMAASMKED